MKSTTAGCGREQSAGTAQQLPGGGYWETPRKLTDCEWFARASWLLRVVLIYVTLIGNFSCLEELDLNPGGFVKAGSLKNKAKMSDEGCCCFGSSVHRLCEGHQ